MNQDFGFDSFFFYLQKSPTRSSQKTVLISIYASKTFYSEIDIALIAKKHPYPAISQTELRILLKTTLI